MLVAVRLTGRTPMLANDDNWRSQVSAQSHAASLPPTDRNWLGSGEKVSTSYACDSIIGSAPAIDGSRSNNNGQ